MRAFVTMTNWTIELLGDLVVFAVGVIPVLPLLFGAGWIGRKLYRRRRKPISL